MWRLPVLGWLLAAVWCLCVVAQAASGAAALPSLSPIDISDQGPPTFTVFGSRDGLGDDVWNAIGFDADGFVWAGSASGLARFDGYRWLAYPVQGGGSRVHGFVLDSESGFWALLQREGLMRWDGSTWHRIGENRSMMQHIDTALDADGKRVFTIGSEDGLLELRSGRWQLVPDAIEGATWERLRTESLFGGPREWLATINGLWFRAADGTEAWQPFTAPELVNAGISDIVRTNERGNEALWVITYGYGLVRIDSGGIRVWRSATGELPSEAMYQGLVTTADDGRESLWIASRGGLIRIRDGRIEWFGRHHGLPSDAVRSLAIQEDVDGVDLLWVATESGIARTALTRSHWQTVSLLGSTYNGTFAVMLEPDGRGTERLWVGGAKDGIGLLEQGQWRTFSQALGNLPFDGTRRIWRLPEGGQMWRLVAPINGGLYQIDDDLQFRPFPVPWDRAPGEGAHAALALSGSDGDTWWFGVRRAGTWRRQAGQWQSFTVRPARPFWTVTALAAQPRPNVGEPILWAASSVGLARFEGEFWQMLPSPTAVAEENFRHVTLLREGDRDVLWAGSSSAGLFRYDVTDPAKPILLPAADLPEPPDPTIYSILPDSQGRIYICTNNGVQRLQRDADGRFREQVFHRRDGLVHDECNSGAQLVDANDRYWVGTLGGLSLYDPNYRAEQNTVRPKPLVLTHVHLDGVPAVAAAFGATLEVPPGIRDVEIGFSLLSGRRESETRYRSQLRGDESVMEPWRTEHRRVFSRLPPGDYRLVVEAQDYAGHQVRADLLALTVKPYWWQQRSLQALLAAGMLLLVLLAIWSYNRGLRARRDELAREVAQRTQALDIVNQQLRELSYRDALTGITNRRGFMESLNAAIAASLSTGQPIGLLLIDVDQFKLFNDRFGHQLGDEALRGVAHTLSASAREGDVIARYGGEEFACLLHRVDAAQALVLAERMRERVAGLPPLRADVDQALTISLGVLSMVPDRLDQADELLRRADAALYEAKRTGRNRVCVAAV